jgi:hypothetical protein
MNNNLSIVFYPALLRSSTSCLLFVGDSNNKSGGDAEQTTMAMMM